MVTSVSTDRGRRQRLQSKSHIQAPASHLSTAMPNTRTGNLAFSLSSAERREERTQREKLSSHLSLQMFGLHAAQYWEKADLINKTFLPPLSSSNGRVKNSV